jgi:predicted secreted protein
MDESPLPIQTPLSTDAGRLARLSEILDDVSARLARVCTAMPEREFRELMARIAEVAVKYEALEELQSVRAVLGPVAEPRDRKP